jgi:hypothetical protein
MWCFASRFVLVYLYLVTFLLTDAFFFNTG